MKESASGRSHSSSKKGLEFDGPVDGPIIIKVIEPSSEVKSEKSAVNTSNCLICCDNIADSVLMDCGHGGLCFHCGIALCINTYESNIKAAQRYLERDRHRDRPLVLKDASCHICR